MTDAAAPSRRIALIAGATGLIGHALLPLLLDGRRYAAVHALLRNGPPPWWPTHERLTVHGVDMDRPPRLPKVDDAYIALGTTIKVAGSQDAFRAVDHDAVLRVASAALSAGATRLAVVSALGADPNSSVFYNRVKGEMQQAVGALGFRSIVFAQPSLLLGDRAALGQPTRPMESLAAGALRPLSALLPARVRPIAADVVARALVQALHEDRPGVRILPSAEMQQLGR